MQITNNSEFVKKVYDCIDKDIERQNSNRDKIASAVISIILQAQADERAKKADRMAKEEAKIDKTKNIALACDTGDPEIINHVLDIIVDLEAVNLQEIHRDMKITYDFDGSKECLVLALEALESEVMIYCIGGNYYTNMEKYNE